MDAKLKHLELIQAVIGRLAQNSFLFKGWAITIAAGLLALGTVDSRASLLAIAVATSLLFWGLDAYYLSLERCFIALYAVVSERPPSDIDFSMSIDKTNSVKRWLVAAGRPHLVLFYGTIVLVEIAAILALEGEDCGAASLL